MRIGTSGVSGGKSVPGQLSNRSRSRAHTARIVCSASVTVPSASRWPSLVCHNSTAVPDVSGTGSSACVQPLWVDGETTSR